MKFSGIKKLSWNNQLILISLYPITLIGTIVFSRVDPDKSEINIFLMPLFLIAFLTLVYFTPSIVAFKREKRNRSAILLINFLLGWTVLGWVLALVWSIMEDK